MVGINQTIIYKPKMFNTTDIDYLQTSWDQKMSVPQRTVATKPKNKHKALATSAFYLEKTKKERRHQEKSRYVAKSQVRLFSITDVLNQEQYEQNSQRMYDDSSCSSCGYGCCMDYGCMDYEYPADDLVSGDIDFIRDYA